MITNTQGTAIDIMKMVPESEKAATGSNQLPDGKDLHTVVASIIEHLSREGVATMELTGNALEKQVERAALKLGYYMRAELTDLVKAHTVGYGLLDRFVTDQGVNNVFVNVYNDVWIQRGLKRFKTDVDFGSDQNVMSFIRILQGKLGGEINHDKSRETFFDSERNLRIVCVIEPVALNGPTIVIRIHRGDNNLSLEELIESEAFSKAEADYILNRIKNNENVIFTGIGGSGKTTAMRAFLEELEAERRIMTMEEEEELKLKKSNVLPYLVKRNERGQVVGMREFISLGVKSSIDTFVFGENSGDEALTLISAAYSGHQVLSTLHTKTLEDVPERLAINMKMSGTDIPMDTLIKMIHRAVDVIVLMKDFKVTSIGEVNKDGISVTDLNSTESLNLVDGAAV